MADKRRSTPGPHGRAPASGGPRKHPSPRPTRQVQQSQVAVLTARDLAREVLERVARTGAYPNRALSAALERSSLSPADRGLATELVYGVLRRQARLDRALEASSDRGLSGIDLGVRVALRMAAYQLLFLDRIPAYAAVDDAVEACKRLRGKGAAGLANALLRRVGRQGEPPLPDPSSDPLGYMIEAGGLPEWLARRLVDELNAVEAVRFADVLGKPAPLSIRTNRLRGGRDELLRRLAAERPAAELAPSPLASDGVLVRAMDAPFETKAFADGWFAAQDTGAQLVVELCGAEPGDRILDACAGLGGKTAHLAALCGNGAHILAVDIAPAKLAQAAETWRRLGVTGASTAVEDLSVPAAAGAPREFDRILLDAPCSGLGVLRRHPETALRRRPEDLAALARTQRAMLEAVAPRLRAGGLLVYSVCTFERAECEDVLAPFLGAHPEIRLEPPSGAPWDSLVETTGPIPGVIRTWPHRHDIDGFFMARMRRVAL